MNEKPYQELTDIIKRSYEEGVTVEEAERLAGKFLHAQITVGNELRAVDLDARMKKQGVKAIRSAVRMNETAKHEKKPTEGTLEDIVNTDELVQGEQSSLDCLEVYRDELQNYLSVFNQAHHHFRAIAKGVFSG